jgi:succinate-semialdehyde dehydrogenase/glutarate-semialdehyde dehydrogenase
VGGRGRGRGPRVDQPAGGARTEGSPSDLYYELTVIDGVPEQTQVSQEESFGPVLPILSAANDDEAAALTNRTHLGLQAAVFTSSLQRAFWYTGRVRSGTVVINDSTEFWETFQPFGGAAGPDTGWDRGSLEEFIDPRNVVSERDHLR